MITSPLSDTNTINKKKTAKIRIYNSKLIKFGKHIGQIIRERIPLLSPLRDVIHEQGMISETRIPRRSIGWRGRIIIVITESIILSVLLFNTHDLYNEAVNNIKTILFHHNRPQHISIQIKTIMICVTLGTSIYYFMIKPGDLQEAIKEHKKEYEEL